MAQDSALRTARLLRHPLEAKLVVPRPSPTAIFEGLSLMRDIVWLPQIVRLPIPATAQQLKGGRIALARTRSGHAKAAKRATAS